MIPLIATDVSSEMLGSILRPTHHSGICGRIYEHGVLQLRPIVWIGDQRLNLPAQPYVYNRLGLRSADAGDSVISLPAGARMNYS